jgi:hypothetical protein
MLHQCRSLYEVLWEQMILHSQMEDLTQEAAVACGHHRQSLETVR